MQHNYKVKELNAEQLSAYYDKVKEYDAMNSVLVFVGNLSTEGTEEEEEKFTLMLKLVAQRDKMAKYIVDNFYEDKTLSSEETNNQ